MVTTWSAWPVTKRSLQPWQRSSEWCSKYWDLDSSNWMMAQDSLSLIGCWGPNIVDYHGLQWSSSTYRRYWFVNTKVTPKKTCQDEVAHCRSHVKARPRNFPNNGDCGGLEDLAFRMLYTWNLKMVHSCKVIQKLGSQERPEALVSKSRICDATFHGKSCPAAAWQDGTGQHQRFAALFSRFWVAPNLSCSGSDREFGSSI